MSAEFSVSYCLNVNCRKPQNPGSFKFCQNCGTKLLLGDRYRALKLIGQGGFGRTFLAVDEGSSVGESTQNLNRKTQNSLCVIKQLLPRTAETQRAIELFRQEAERLAELGRHPQIPELLAHFEFESAQYLVQQYIEGQNLEEVLRQEGAFGERQVRDLLVDLLPVLQFIHSRQVIHRDIKPENIIRSQQGDRLFLVDFGAAKSATATAMARTGTMIGSAGYVAPEQAMGKAEFASDLYSLGATCVHLLTGLHPFDLYSVSEDAWVWQQYLPRPVSSRLRRVLDKLLQKATSQRYRTATEVLQDLGVTQETITSEKQNAPPSSPTEAKTKSATVRPAPSEQVWRSVHTLTGHEGQVTALAISPGGRIVASGSRDKAIKFWSLASGKLLHTFAGRSLWFGEGHTGSISDLAFSADGETLVSASEDGTLKWWDLDERQVIYTLPSHGWSMTALAFYNKGYLLACGSSDGLIQLWDLSNQKLIRNLNQHTDRISSLVFAPDRRTLYSSSYDKTICLWDWQTGTAIKTLSGHTDRVSSIALSPDGRTLVSGSYDKTVKVWDLDYAEQRKVMSAHKKPVTSLAFHPRGDLFVTGSEDCTLKLWDLETGDRLCTLRSFWGVNTVAFSPDGKTLASGSADEVIKLWRRDR